MPIEDYAAQPFIQEQELLKFTAKICLSNSENDTGLPLLQQSG